MNGVDRVDDVDSGQDVESSVKCLFCPPSRLTLFSPSKINLFLRILKRREDGYHELASLMQAIDLCDILKFSLGDQDSLTCTDPVIPVDGNNLVLKAAQLFRRKTGLRHGLTVHLEKRIPIQAGLGGGSGNAATTLWAFNELCGRPAQEEDLALWSGEIGSDISFFFSKGTAYCTGRGEIIRALEPLPAKTLHIAKPVQGLSTPQVYGALNVAALPQRNSEEALNLFLKGQTPYFNDLETPAFSVLPKLAGLKSHLQACGFTEVTMSGSGSAFFCMGKGNVPDLPEVTFYQANYLTRAQGAWYSQ